MLLNFIVNLLICAAALLIVCSVLTHLLGYHAKTKLPPTGQFTKVTGGTLHWTETGTGAPIILIHGLGGNLFNYNYMIPELAQRYRVISIDRLGSGWSTRDDPSRADLRAQANTIAEFIDIEGLERPLLVGHSLGAGIAITVGVFHPDKIRGLALICPSSMGMQDVPKPFRQMDIKNAAWRLFLSHTMLGPVALMREGRVFDAIFKPEPITSDFLIKGGVLLGRLPRQFRTTCEDLVAAKASQHEVARQLSDLTVPTHALIAQDDNILDIQLHGVKFSDLTGAPLTMVPRAGHMLPMTQPTLCNSFIQKVMETTQ